MTDTVVAAIITTSGVLLVGVISHWRKTHQPSQQEPKPVIIQPIIAPAVSHPVADFKTPAKSDPVSDLSHARISEVIESVPPLQQDTVMDSFVGVTVTWRGKLFSAARKGSGIYVTLDGITQGGLVHCRAESFSCVELLVAPKGAEVIVAGKIKDIGKYGANLEDCKFEIPQKAA